MDANVRIGPLAYCILTDAVEKEILRQSLRNIDSRSKQTTLIQKIVNLDSFVSIFANITLIEDPAKNFVVIMKDGKIYKNTAN